jgi:hypothetical protein
MLSLLEIDAIPVLLGKINPEKNQWKQIFKQNYPIEINIFFFIHQKFFTIPHRNKW